MPTKKSVPTQIIDFLASVKLALVLLLALAVTSIIGTVIPQNLHPHQYLEGYGPRLYTFLSHLGLFDMYNSWWYRFLLAALVVNLIVCSFKRLPGSMLLARPVDGDKVRLGWLKKQSFSESLVLNGPLDSHIDTLKSALKRLGRPKQAVLDWGTLLYAEKGRFSRFGVYIIHFSLLFFIAGGMIGTIYGFSSELRMNEGQTADRLIAKRPAGAEIQLPFTVRLDRFEVRFYDNGAPSLFQSDVTVLENGEPVKEASIIMNHPLTYRGVTFYQSSYGPIPKAVTIKLKAKNSDTVHNATIPTGKITELPHGMGQATLVELAENLMGAGPAARIVVQPPEGDQYSEWVFEKRPAFMPPPKGDLEFSLVDLEISYWTGLQVNRDPGVWFIWIGCSLMIVGFVITFFFSHQRVFMGLEEAGGKTSLTLAGSAHRNKGSFQIKFERLAEKLAPDKQRKA
jgi:cytochrome c biogenesis protein